MSEYIRLTEDPNIETKSIDVGLKLASNTMFKILSAGFGKILTCPFSNSVIPIVDKTIVTLQDVAISSQPPSAAIV